MAALPPRPGGSRRGLATPLPALAQTPAAQAPPARTPPAETTGVTAEQAPQVHVIEGDVLSLPGSAGHVGAIVSPAHGTLLAEGSEIAAQILEAGGEDLFEDIIGRYPGAELPDGGLPGEAVQTSAPGIGADYVIHVVPPDFRRTGRAEALDQLAAAYRNAVGLAGQLGLDSIAIPLLPDGAYRGPMPLPDLESAAATALGSIQTTVRNVYLLRPAPEPAPEALAGPATKDALAQAVAAVAALGQGRRPRQEAARLNRERAQRAYT